MALGLFLFFPFLLLIFSYLIKSSLLIINNNENRESRIKYPPGSRGILPYIGESLQFIAAIYTKQGFYSFVQARHLRYGKCFKTHILGETNVFVSDTKSAKEILSNDLGKFTKKYMRSIGEVIGSQSLLCASHQNHNLLRSHLLDLFTSNSISQFTTQFDELVVNTLSTWERREHVFILHESLKMTLKAMCKMLLSLEAKNEELCLLQKDVAYVCQAMLAFPWKFPWTTFSKGLKSKKMLYSMTETMRNKEDLFRIRDFLQKGFLCEKRDARKRIMEMLAKIIKERKDKESIQDPSIYDHKDVLQYLLSTDSNILTDAQIKDNILTMIIAGQDTTASAMTWMVKYLDENQGVLAALQDEVKYLQNKVAKKSFLTLKDLNEMKYGAKVVKETLRMSSIVPWFPRVALHDCQISGFMIKKGWNVNVDARSIHFDPSLHKSDPHKFIPSRFENEAKPYSFLAFGAGGRTCLGMNLAKTMMLVFLYRLITTYSWEVTDPDSSVEKWTLFARLKSGCPVRVKPLRN